MKINLENKQNLGATRSHQTYKVFAPGDKVFRYFNRRGGDAKYVNRVRFGDESKIHGVTSQMNIFRYIAVWVRLRIWVRVMVRVMVSVTVMVRVT